MLLQIYERIKREGLRSQQQLARELALDPLALQAMLDFLERKGRIQSLAAEGCRTRCLACKGPENRYYEIAN